MSLRVLHVARFARFALRGLPAMGKRAHHGDAIVQKMQRILEKSCCTVTHAAQALETEWSSAAALETLGHDLRNRNVVTEYGSLLDTMKVELADEVVYEGPFVNPHVLLRHVTEMSVPAAQFFKKHLQNKVAHIFFHVDEARLGNVLRPDAGRSFQSITWCIGQTPDWYRNREAGFIPFAMMPAKTVNGSNISAVFGHILEEIFFAEHGFNFNTGIILHSGEDGWLPACCNHRASIFQ